MTLPTEQISTTNIDSVDDSPSQALAQIKQAVDSLNQMIASFNHANGIATLNAKGRMREGDLPGVDRGLSYINGMLGHSSIAPATRTAGGGNNVVKRIAIDGQGHVTELLTGGAVTLTSWYGSWADTYYFRIAFNLTILLPRSIMKATSLGFQIFNNTPANALFYQLEFRSKNYRFNDNRRFWCHASLPVTSISSGEVENWTTATSLTLNDGQYRPHYYVLSDAG